MNNSGSNIVVVQRVDSKGRLNNRKVDVNKVLTVYGREYLEGQIQDALADNRILYVDKKRSHMVAGGTNKRLVSGRNLDFKNNIDDFWANVNYEKAMGRFSIPEYTQEEMDAHRQHLIDTATEFYGEPYTEDLNESGFILPDGNLPRMGMYGSRADDHNLIIGAYDDIGYDTSQHPKADAMARFLNEGNIRYMPENGSIELGTEIEPTYEQYARIREMDYVNMIEFTFLQNHNSNFDS